MKHVKHMLVAVLTVFLAAVLAVPAFAAGNGTITVSNAEIGKTYELYKLFDATVGADGQTAYKLPEGKAVPADSDAFHTWFKIENGNVIPKDAFTADVLKTDDFKTWAQSFGTKIGDTVTASSSTVEFTNLDFGYYFVKTNTGATLTVDSANPHADVIDKNQTVTSDKKIIEGENELIVNEAGLNEDVNFKITVNAKQYEGDEKIFKYVIYDTMETGFALTEDPVVKVGETTLTADKYTITYKNNNTSQTTPTGADYFEISIPWTNDGTIAGDFLYDANAKIVVTYTAKLDPAQAANVKVGKDPNENTAEVKFFKGNDEPDTPSGDGGTHKTETYDTKLTITKTDGEDILTGAEFTLTSTNGTKVSYVTGVDYVKDNENTYTPVYYKLTDGTFTDEAPNGDSTHDAVYESKTDKYKMEPYAKVMGENQTDTNITAAVGADGKVTFSGLGAGDYKIEETKVPAGYNKAADIEFTISFDGRETINDEANPNYKKFSSNNDAIVLDATNNVFETTVVNNQGTELPSTGGMGTTILYTVGGIMVIAGIVMFLTKRRMASIEK